MKTKLQVTIEVTIQDGAYFPAFVTEAVHNDPRDPWKDESSMLVQSMTAHFDTLHGIEAESIEVMDLGKVPEEGDFYA